MFKLCDRITFCIRLSTDLDLCPTRSFIVSSTSTDHPPSTSIIMLNCFTSYPGYCCFSSHLNGTYLAVFSASLIALLSIHGQLISITATRFLFLYYSCVNSVSFHHHRTLCINWYIPESLSSFILVHWFRLDRRVPWWYLGYQVLISKHFEEQNLQG